MRSIMIFLFVLFASLPAGRTANAAGLLTETEALMESLSVKAEAGDTFAQVNLGYIYHMLEIFPDGGVQAERWYLPAAEQGFADIQTLLGELYHEGDEGLPPDDEKAIDWFEKAVEQGFPPAALGLHRVYIRKYRVNAECRDVPCDDWIQAYKWRTVLRALDQGLAAQMLPMVPPWLQRVDEVNPIDPVKEGKRLASEWLERHKGAKPKMLPDAMPEVLKQIDAEQNRQ